MTDVDLLYAELKQRGAKIVKPPSQVRADERHEMVVEDKIGFGLALAMEI